MFGELVADDGIMIFRSGILRQPKFLQMKFFGALIFFLALALLSYPAFAVAQSASPAGSSASINDQVQAA